MQCQEGMDIPLDLKLFMSGTTKVYKCDQCPSSYSDKAYFELHKQSHQKDTNIQIITMNQQPAPAHQQVNAQQVDQLTAYKRAYSGETQQVCYVQYQVPVSNARAVQMAVVSSGPQQQVNMPTFTTPTYVTTTIPTTVLAAPITQPQQIQQQEQPEHHQPQAQSQQQQQQQQQPQQQQQQQPQQQVIRQRQVVVDRKDRPYKCDQCTASFIDPDELSDHKKKHSGDGPFTCEDCHFTFMYKSHFRSHKTRCQKKRAMMPHPPKPFISHGPLKRQFPTNQSHTAQHQRSNNRTSNKTTPAHHAKQNQNSAPFNPANPTFKRQKKDMRADRPFECNECDASFQTMQDLQTHKAKHTGEGPFKCEECRFVFLYRKLYDAHRRRCEKKRKENQMIVNQAQQQQHQEQQQQQQAQTHHQQHQAHAQPQHVQVQVRPVVTAPAGSGTSVAIATPVQVQQAIPHPHQQQQTTVIDMRGQVQVQQPTLIEQVIHAAPSRVTEIKYDMVPTTVEMDQIMNLIKVKGPQQ